MTKKILLATQKPFSETALDSIKEIIDGNVGYSLELLESYSEESELIRAVERVDALIVRSDIVSEAAINHGNSLSIIVRAGAGFDNIDLGAATKRDIVVMNTPGQNANAVAELAFGLMLVLIRKKYTGIVGTELRNKNIGLHAYGNVAKCVATIAKGFGMKVFTFDPYIEKSFIEADNVLVCESVEELYSISDYISIHIPVVKETVRSIDYNLLSKTKKNTVLINTSRKEVIDEKGLIKWMDENANVSFASDVAPDFKKEISEKFPERIFFTTKKMGAQTAEANINAGIAAATQIIRFFEDGDRTFQVNK